MVKRTVDQEPHELVKALVSQDFFDKRLDFPVANYRVGRSFCSRTGNKLPAKYPSSGFVL
jgi:carbohydrate-selective porin OprB